MLRSSQNPTQVNDARKVTKIAQNALNAMARRRSSLANSASFLQRTIALLHYFERDISYDTALFSLPGGLSICLRYLYASDELRFATLKSARIRLHAKCELQRRMQTIFCGLCEASNDKDKRGDACLLGELRYCWMRMTAFKKMTP